ncbi:cytochrome c oxidase assembly protein [Cellulosimicrobium sp. Marseille-Q4280]|uniref:cytochrome c oxidase assembly protein n=1 Tax=Cellulosimicrobium sp. Marseille-Q4280 TaxID=2937992 RepID=UPI002041B5E8|nr:cytochrome c oxidase assembly protein [Cellulosimicrobium sp. Marseille-Q4280]
MTSHGDHGGAGLGLDGESLLVLAALGVVAWAYLVLALRQHADPRGWSPWRTASFLGGVALLAAALVPALSPLPTGSFADHMYRHLLVGMYAPLALVLGAPVTLVLRSVGPRAGRRVGRLLRRRPVQVLAHPVTAVLLSVGTLYVVYLTPLYAATTQHPTLHHLVHLHFLAAGYLFAYALAGPDPAPHRPSVRARLVVLGVAIAAHAVLAQLLYAGAFVAVPGPAADRRTGAELMYYGGDLAVVLLALALVSTWRPVRAPTRAVHTVTARTTTSP